MSRIKGLKFRDLFLGLDASAEYLLKTSFDLGDCLVSASAPSAGDVHHAFGSVWPSGSEARMYRFECFDVHVF